MGVQSVSRSDPSENPDPRVLDIRIRTPGIQGEVIIE